SIRTCAVLAAPIWIRGPLQCTTRTADPCLQMRKVIATCPMYPYPRWAVHRPAYHPILGILGGLSMSCSAAKQRTAQRHPASHRAAPAGLATLALRRLLLRTATCQPLATTDRTARGREFYLLHASAGRISSSISWNVCWCMPRVL